LKPIIFTDKLGNKISSIKYNNLKEGKAININIIAGIIVHTISNIEPCVKYFNENGDL
jgi:hypothetical protein